jgi:hypothetical protein
MKSSTGKICVLSVVRIIGSLDSTVNVVSNHGLDEWDLIPSRRKEFFP